MIENERRLIANIMKENEYGAVGARHVTRCVGVSQKFALPVG